MVPSQHVGILRWEVEPGQIAVDTDVAKHKALLHMGNFEVVDDNFVFGQLIRIINVLFLTQLHSAWIIMIV